MPKYKRIPVPERPEWGDVGFRVRSIVQNREGTIAALYGADDEHPVRVKFDGGYDDWLDWSDLEPVLEWEPVIGEMVATWHDRDPLTFGFRPYTGFGILGFHVHRVPPEWKNIPEQNTIEYFSKQERLV